MNTTLFVFGTHPVLSFAEVLRTFKLQPEFFAEVSTEGLVYGPADAPAMLDRSYVQRELAQLGGIIKIAEVFDAIPIYEDPRLDLTLHIAEYLNSQADRTQELTFGISVYGDSPVNASNLCRFVKKELKTADTAQIRYVLPSEDNKTLSSAQVIHHGLSSDDLNRFEIVIFKGVKRYFLARTNAVQDIVSYVERDEGRPSRRRDEGMMPIKLTQMLINFAGRPKAGGSTPLLLDPFCGSGTILQEALRVGYDVIGTDISTNTIRSAQANLAWYAGRFMKGSPRSFQLFPVDARKITSTFAPETFDAVVSEGYLGTLYSQAPTEAQLDKEVPSLRDMYFRSLSAMLPILKPGGLIAITCPYYLKKHLSIIEPLLDSLEKIGYNHQSLLPDTDIPVWAQMTEHGTYIYSRPDQIVGREIILLKKTTRS